VEKKRMIVLRASITQSADFMNRLTVANKSILIWQNRPGYAFKRATLHNANPWLFSLSFQVKWLYLTPRKRAMEFKLTTTENGSRARAGTIFTDHGIVETPIFMPATSGMI